MVEETSYSEIIDETCPSCRHTIPQDSVICPNCGFRIRDEPMPVGTKTKDRRPVAAQQGFSLTEFGGTLILMSGILAFFTGITTLIYPEVISDLFQGVLGVEFGTDLIIIYGAIIIVFGVVAEVGGIMALRQRNWKLAFIGGVLGTVSAGALFLGSMLGLVGVFMIYASRGKFKS